MSLSSSIPSLTVRNCSPSTSSISSVLSCTPSQTSTTPTEYNARSTSPSALFHHDFLNLLFTNKGRRTTNFLAQFASPELLREFLKKLAVEHDWSAQVGLLTSRLFFSLLKHPLADPYAKEIISWLLKSEDLDSHLEADFQSYSIHYLACSCQCRLLLFVLKDLYSTSEKQKKIASVDKNKFSILHQLAIGLTDQQAFATTEIIQLTELLRTEKFDFMLLDSEQQTAQQILQEGLDESCIETATRRQLITAFDHQ